MLLFQEANDLNFFMLSKKSAAIAELVSDFGLVGFEPLDIGDKVEILIDSISNRFDFFQFEFNLK